MRGRKIRKIAWLMAVTIMSSVFGTVVMAENLMAEPEIAAKGAVLIEPKTNTILYEKNAHKTFYPASITKILTALIVSEEMKDSTIITKSKACIENVPWDSSQIGLEVGDSYSKTEGLYGLLLGSDNFIAYDLACSTAGDIPSFARKMNEKAKSLGAYDSHFVNPHGYHDPDHYTTPYDMAEIARGAFSNPMVGKITGTAKHKFYIHNKGTSFTITNSSRLLKSETPYYNPNVVSCKTGFHDDARQTLVAKAVYDNIELIAVVMKDETPGQYEDINKLFEYGRTNYSLKQVNGSYILENRTISMEMEKAVKHFNQRGWVSEGLDFRQPIKAKELKDILKKMKSSQPEIYIDEIMGLLGIDEEDYVTKSQLATIIMYLNDKWHPAGNNISLLEDEALLARQEKIGLGKTIKMFYDINL